MKTRFQNLKTLYRKWTESAIVVNAMIFVILSAVIFTISYRYLIRNPDGFFEQIVYASFGMLFDIAVLGILITWLTERREKRNRILSYINEIDDFRNWVSEEAMFRTVGNIKRLNKNLVTEMNLVDCSLRNVNLNYTNLKNSNLNSADLSSSSLIGMIFTNCRLNQTNFENSNINHGEFIESYATGANFKDSYLIKSNFEKAYLIKTNFENAYLIEANFKGAILSDANFNNASLYKADLTNTSGLKAEQLLHVKSLYLAKLDRHIIDKLRELAPYLLTE
jgi:BTB/POZ domain-containing protein KCTD9